MYAKNNALLRSLAWFLDDNGEKNRLASGGNRDNRARKSDRPNWGEYGSGLVANQKLALPVVPDTISRQHIMKNLPVPAILEIFFEKLDFFGRFGNNRG